MDQADTGVDVAEITPGLTHYTLSDLATDHPTTADSAMLESGSGLSDLEPDRTLPLSFQSPTKTTTRNIDWLLDAIDITTEQDTRATIAQLPPSPDLLPTLAAGLLSSSLEEQETIGSDPVVTGAIINGPANAMHCPVPTQAETLFRHSGWTHRRSQVIAALVAIANPRQAQAAACCGGGAYVWQSRRGDVEVRSHTCKNRWCTPCAVTRATKARGVILSHVRTRLQSGAHLRFYTLTLKHSTRPLADQLEHLAAAWRAFRHTPQYKAHIAGGIATLELKYSTTKGWHPHIHIVAEGDFWPQADLSRVWLNCTGDSFIVHVRDIGGMEADAQAHAAATYATKYVTKAVDGSVYAITDRLQEAMRALAGRRVFDKLGNWRTLELIEDETDKEETDDATWTCLGTLDHIIKRARSADPDAFHIVRLLTLNKDPKI